MKHLITVLFIIFSTTFVFSQTHAVTKSGEEVLLFENGTWKYAKEKDAKKKEIETNNFRFMRSPESTFLVESKILNVGVYINPEKWSFKKGETNGNSEYDFQLVEQDAYAMAITERIEVPLVTLKGLALENAQIVAPDTKIVDEEYRTINGIKMLYLQMDGTLKGIPFTYFGYYYSNKKGTVQLICYTSQSLVAEYKSSLFELLNGLVVTE